jgi:hypothetical protein
MIIGNLHIDTEAGKNEFNVRLDDAWLTKRLCEAVEAKQMELQLAARDVPADWYNLVVDGSALKIEGTNVSIDLGENVVRFVSRESLDIFLGGVAAIRDGMFRGELKSRIGFESERAQWQDQLLQMVQQVMS